MPLASRTNEPRSRWAWATRLEPALAATNHELGSVQESWQVTRSAGPRKWASRGRAVEGGGRGGVGVAGGGGRGGGGVGGAPDEVEGGDAAVGVVDLVGGEARVAVAAGEEQELVAGAGVGFFLGVGEVEGAAGGRAVGVDGE